MSTGIVKPSAALLLSILVPTDVRSLLNWRTVLNGKIPECGTETLMVQIGPPKPYRLLMLHGEADGLIRIQIVEYVRRGTVIYDDRAISDLVAEKLRKAARDCLGAF